MLTRREVVRGIGGVIAGIGASQFVPASHAASPRLHRLGVYVSNKTEHLDTFEAWLGRRVSLVGVFVGERDWQDFNAVWLLDLWKAKGRELHWSIPLLVEGATLANAAAGDYDRHYSRIAREIARWPGSGPLYIRTGWEFNFSWMKWAAAGKEAQYIAAFRRFVSCFREASTRFRFEWCPNIGDGRRLSELMNPAAAYPGHNFVDVIGLDHYYKRKWESPDPLTAFKSQLTRPYGLRWHVQFAAWCRKPAAYSEWGVNSDGKGRYMRLFNAWVYANNILWQNYWDRSSVTDCRLSNGNFPQTGDGYIAAFGAGRT
jgi:hypothetical protein